MLIATPCADQRRILRSENKDREYTTNELQWHMAAQRAWSADVSVDGDGVWPMELADVHRVMSTVLYRVGASLLDQGELSLLALGVGAINLA